jgi:hypothetical protein
MRRSLSFLVATKADADAFMQRLSDRRIDADKSPSLGRLGETAVVRAHGDITKFMGDNQPGSYEAQQAEDALVADLTKGLNVTQDHSRTTTEE